MRHRGGAIVKHMGIRASAKSTWYFRRPSSVFVSHAAADAKLASFLAQEIRHVLPGLNIFLTTQPGDLVPAEPWLHQTERELARRSIYLVLLTRNSVGR